ncbi:MAG: hypothetical protein ACK58L_20935 [Planctomycetota bacterium]
MRLILAFARKASRGMGSSTDTLDETRLSFVKQLLKAVIPVLDLCLALLVLPSAFVMEILRRG